MHLKSGDKGLAGVRSRPPWSGSSLPGPPVAHCKMTSLEETAKDPLCSNTRIGLEGDKGFHGPSASLPKWVALAKLPSKLHFLTWE